MTGRVCLSLFLILLSLVVIGGTAPGGGSAPQGAEEARGAEKAKNEGFFTGIAEFLKAAWGCAAAAFSTVVGMAERVFKPVFTPINRALSAIPVSAARWVAVGYIVLGALWTFLLPRKYIYEGAPSQAWWRDLRLWAVVFLLPFALIYLLW